MTDPRLTNPDRPLSARLSDDKRAGRRHRVKSWDEHHRVAQVAMHRRRLTPSRPEG